MSDAHLKLAGVCGWPVHHSISPALHGFWLSQLGIKGAYVHFAVRPDEANRAFKSLKKTTITGVNVTIPLKHIAYLSADESTQSAQKMKVANCLFKRDGKLIAHNTDLEGFSIPLLQNMGRRGLSNHAAFVVGAGGAACAVIHALLALNCPEIRLSSRRNEQAEHIVDGINVPNLYAVGWNDRHHAIRSSGLIINASAGGMRGKSPLDVDLAYALPGTFIYDLVYTPLKTPLIEQAEQFNLPHIGGLDMLIAQARPSFKLFFGQSPPDNLDPKPFLLDILHE